MTPDETRREAERWTTVDIVDQFERFIRKPELEADAEWVAAFAYAALLARVQELEAEVSKWKVVGEYYERQYATDIKPRTDAAVARVAELEREVARLKVKIIRAEGE